MVASSNPGMDQANSKSILESLQQQDQDIDNIVITSKFVVAYLLQQDGPNPGWRKANIEGPVYLLRRSAAPKYQLLVKNQFSTYDLLDNLHPDWELDCQKNYVFYKVEDPNKRIRGLWFQDDSERTKIEEALERALDELRNRPAVEPQTVPQPAPKARAPPPSATGNPPAPAAPLPAAQVPAEATTTITMSSLRTALHSLAEDDAFVRMVMQKLKETQPPTRAGG